jgi:hypothetical protein
MPEYAAPSALTLPTNTAPLRAAVVAIALLLTFATLTIAGVFDASQSAPSTVAQLHHHAGGRLAPAVIARHGG